MAIGGAYVSDLSVFPVKSLRGAAQTEIAVEPCGFAGDRRWMVVDESGRFMTQREHPIMALVQASLSPEGMVLSTAGGPPLTVPDGAGAAGPDTIGAALRPVRIWNDVVTARDCGDPAAAWLSAALGAPCRLMHLADPAGRKIRAPYNALDTEAVSFADGFPVLLASAASLANLNGRLAHPVPMRRFRPNLVVDGIAAWEEDTWRRIRVGGAIFRIAKPCDRCIMTTLDPATGLQPDGNEPLRSLSLFRRTGSGIMFGQNLVPEHCGIIRIGDRVDVLEAGHSNVVAR